MFAWVAIRHCVAFGFQFPHPIVNYIYHVAETLVLQSTVDSDLKVRTAVRDAVFGCQRKRGGPGSFFTTYLREWPSLKLRYEEEVTNRPEMAAAQTLRPENFHNAGSPEDDQSEHHAADFAITTLAFEATKNPIFAWVAARHCAFSGHMLPESVAAYMIQVADALLAEAERPEGEGGCRLDVRDAVRNAVFGRPNRKGGPGTPYTNYRRDLLNIKTVIEIAERTSGFDIESISCTNDEVRIKTDYAVVESIYEFASKNAIGDCSAIKNHYEWERRLLPARKPLHRRGKPAS